jgi:SulP family sulfate permease
MIKSQFMNAVTIALLAGIESLLSAVVADSMIGSTHRSNMELIAQGLGNIGSACFGGIPATGAIARTAANIKSGGRTPIAGMVHSIMLVLVVAFLMPFAKMIPMPCIAAILFQVAYNMSGWRNFAKLCKSSPKSDIVVLVLTFALTVIFDLVVAIEVGIIVTSVLFMKRMSDVTQVEGWKEVDDENDPDSLSLRKIPDHTVVYEFSGPMFFAAAGKILQISFKPDTKVLVIRMRSVGAMDATAMHNLEQLYEDCAKKGIQIVLSHVNEQPLTVIQKAGFDEKIGKDNFAPHIDDALTRAEELAGN